MTRKITLVPRGSKSSPTLGPPAVEVPVSDFVNAPEYRECFRCKEPIMVGQHVRTLTTDVRVYVAHLDDCNHG